MFARVPVLTSLWRFLFRAVSFFAFFFRVLGIFFFFSGERGCFACPLGSCVLVVLMVAGEEEPLGGPYTNSCSLASSPTLQLLTSHREEPCCYYFVSEPLFYFFWLLFALFLYGTSLLCITSSSVFFSSFCVVCVAAPCLPRSLLLSPLLCSSLVTVPAVLLFSCRSLDGRQEVQPLCLSVSALLSAGQGEGYACVCV